MPSRNNLYGQVLRIIAEDDKEELSKFITINSIPWDKNTPMAVAVAKHVVFEEPIANNNLKPKKQPHKDYMDYTMQTKSIYDRSGGRCFFSGIKCLIGVDDKNILKASTEHLIPGKFASASGLNVASSKHLVLSADRINHSLGNAPLKVKFQLKDYLSKQNFDMSPSDALKMHHAMHHVQLFLKTFKVHGRAFPWEWRGMSNNIGLRQFLFDRYLELLTQEELALLKKVNKRLPRYFEGMKWS